MKQNKTGTKYNKNKTSRNSTNPEEGEKEEEKSIE